MQVDTARQVLAEAEAELALALASASALTEEEATGHQAGPVKSSEQPFKDPVNSNREPVAISPSFMSLQHSAPLKENPVGTSLARPLVEEGGWREVS